MLGLILIYWIGKNFYDLAKAHNKNQWLYAILGVISYYAGTFIFAILYFLYLDSIQNSMALESSNEWAVSLMSVPVGLLCCWGLYKFLHYKWTNQVMVEESDILDDDFI